MTDETIDETAGLHVLGVLTDQERQAVTDRMAGDPALQQAVAAWSQRLAPLLDTVPAMTPPRSAWDAIQARIAATKPTARRSDEGKWLSIAPGATMRYLHVDPVTGARSAMLRMDTDSAVPEHDHDDLEECFVVAGTVDIDGENYQSGDHIVAGAGTRHLTIKALTPVTLLLHWSAALA